MARILSWEDNIYGMVRQEDWLAIGSQIPTRPSDPADLVINDLKTDNLVAKWESMASEYSIPVMAQFHGFDTEAKTTFRIPIDTHSIEKGLIKVKINQSERLRALTRSGVVGDSALYNYVMDDGLRLADQVITRTKVAKNELLATGKVTIKENNLNLTVDYGVPAAHTQYTLDFSENASASIPDQIQQIVDDALDAGRILTGMFTSRKIINKLRANKEIQKLVSGIYAEGALLSRAQLEGYLADEFGITQIITNDLTYGASSVIGADGRPSITSKRYFPDNVVTFFASNAGSRLGTGLWGNPPEIDADVARMEQISASGLDPYVYIMQWAEKDPSVLWTKASSLFMPVLFDPNSLWIATVDDSF